MSVHRKLHRHFVPSHHNSYRPHVLRTGWLLFFIGMIMVSEGMFVSGIFVEQAGAGSVSIENSQIAAVDAAPTSFLNSFGRNLARITVDSKTFVPWELGIIATILT